MTSPMDFVGTQARVQVMWGPGLPHKIWKYQGGWFWESGKGHSFWLEVTNPFPHPVEVRVVVNGRNALKNRNNAMVIRPYGKWIVPGWQLPTQEHDEVEDFTFAIDETQPEKGVICVAVYRQETMLEEFSITPRSRRWFESHSIIPSYSVPSSSGWGSEPGYDAYRRMSSPI